MGYPATNHIGAYFLDAAQELGIEATLLDATQAQAANLLVRQINWRLRGHRPANLGYFSNTVIEACERLTPTCLLVTGITAPDALALYKIRSLGIRTINYLTDDPWNPVHFAPWFLKALPYYSRIYSPRNSNLRDLEQLGCSAEFLPFAYSPKYHFRQVPREEQSDFQKCDVLFYGGADQDRLPYIYTLQETGRVIHVYGGYWSQNARTRSISKGLAGPETLRMAVSSAKMTLCLVRRSNRDGHSMRSFEAPAMGGCLIVEDTDEHRQLFGDDLHAVAYFRSHAELKQKIELLYNRVSLREKLRTTVEMTVTSQPNTYKDRLRHMILETCS